MTENHFTIKSVQNSTEDVEILSTFMGKLAEFDGHKANIEPKKLQKQLFAQNTNVRSYLAYLEDTPIGFILFYECFTVYHGERGLYVPGAYIKEEYRGKGYGKKLFQYVAQYALENNFEFMNWLVESDNSNAREFYKKMDAMISDNWSYVRIPKEAMRKMRTP